MSSQLPRRTILAVQYGSFLGIGVISGALGPLIPAIRADLKIDYAGAGLVFSAQSLGSLVVLLAGPWLLHLFDKKPVIVAGGILFSAGLIATALSQGFVTLLLGNLAVGAGMSFLDIGISTLCLESNPDGKGKALNRLHFFFGLGAVMGPLLVLALARTGPGAWRWTIALISLLPLVFVLMLLPLRIARSPRATVGAKFGVYKQPLLWLAGLSLMVYVGVEWGVGAWFPSYWLSIPQARGVDPSWAAMLFWLTFALGRLFVGGLVDRLGFAKFLSYSLGATLVLVMVWLLVPVPLVSVLAILCFGFAIAGQYPSFVALAAQPFPESSGQVASFLSVFAGLGTFFILPGMGALADNFGIERLPWMELGALVLLIIAALATFRAERKYLGRRDRT